MTLGRSSPQGSDCARLPTSDIMPKYRRRKGSSSPETERSFHKKAKTVTRKGLNTPFNTKSCLSWFREYTSNDEDVLGPDGMEKFCEDIGVEPENVVMLVLAWKLQARNMGFFQVNEWMNGMEELQCDCVQKLQAKLDHLRSLLNDRQTFKSIYRFAFDFAKEENQRSLEKDTAKAMLSLLLGGQWQLQSLFIQFLDHSALYSMVNRDQWYNVLEFSRSIRTDLSNYDSDGAWPVMLDEFVDWLKSHRHCGGSVQTNAS